MHSLEYIKEFKYRKRKAIFSDLKVMHEFLMKFEHYVFKTVIRKVYTLEITSLLFARLSDRLFVLYRLYKSFPK